MSYAFVQQSEASAAASGTSLTTPAISVTAGNLRVVFVKWDTASGGTLGCSDGTDTFTQVALKDLGSGSRWAIYYKQNSSSGSLAVSFTWTSATSNRSVYVAEYSGISTTSALIAGAYDVDTSITTSGTDCLITDAINVTSQPALMVGVGWTESFDVADVASGTGCTSRGTGWDFGTTASARLQDKSVTATGNATMAWTGIYGSQNKQCAVATFAEASNVSIIPAAMNYYRMIRNA